MLWALSGQFFGRLGTNLLVALLPIFQPSFANLAVDLSSTSPVSSFQSLVHLQLIARPTHHRCLGHRLANHSADSAPRSRRTHRPSFDRLIAKISPTSVNLPVVAASISPPTSVNISAHSAPISRATCADLWPTGSQSLGGLEACLSADSA
jgi:hypothetical protein